MATRSYQIRSGKHFRKEGSEMKVYRPGDWIKMTEAEAAVIKDKLILNTTPASLIKEPETSKDEVGLKLVSLGSGKYNVVNEKTKRPVNERPLSKEDAEALIGE